jgi:pimeloyl-ACP methyl ester carboxylesterase
MIYSKKIILLLSMLSLLLFFDNITATDNLADGIKADSNGYFEINNVKLYYEILGKGESLLYLHGGLSSSKDFRKYILEFSKNFQVITIDRRGHGRSFDNNEPYSYSSMADDMNLFLKYLKIDSAFVIGWSDGGVVGYYLASKNPSRITKLIAVGANYLVNGMTKSSIEWITNQLTVENISKSFPEVEKEYKKLNPHPENFDNFINKTRNMWLHDPYISKEDFIKINIPVLLVAGDKDDIRLDHMIEMHSLLKKSQLCILPNTTHFVFDEYNDIVTKILIDFLK